MGQQQSLVIVLGANGRFGRSVVEAFAAAGWQVRAQMRNPDRWQAKAWPNGVVPCFCDAHDRAALCRAADGAQVVVNALNPLYTEWQQYARALGENALAAARASGALLLFPGNVYNFGKRLPEQLLAQTPQVGNTAKAKIRIEMEAALQAAAADGVDSVVLRAGDYFGGARRGAWFDLAIAKDLRKGKMIYPGPRDRVHAWAYLPDFAEVFVRVAAQRAKLHGYHVYHFPGYAITGAQMQQALEQVVGRRLRVAKLPWWSLRLAAPFSPMLRAIVEMRYLWDRPHRLVDSALRELIGPLPSTPLAEALHTAIVELDLLPVQGTLRHA
jgi:nucleoside-diphosphate-sugar epimerase